MKFNVPFLPNTHYTDFLKVNKAVIHSCHVSLPDPAIPDARHKTGATELPLIIRYLSELNLPRAYALLNSRVHGRDIYGGKAGIETIGDRLQKLVDADVIHGIVFADPYLLQALSRRSADLASRLEAVPSVNCMIDSYDKFLSFLDIIAASGFKPPETLVPDRAMNRRYDDLADLSAQVRRHHPGMAIELLVNEGCIYHCPFKLTHDALISLQHITGDMDIHEINRKLGCMDYLFHHPHLIFKSPFIRPEDVARYSGVADRIKICGRTLGPGFLINAITAYMAGRYEGNLLSILDAADWLAEKYEIDNSRLPKDFLEKLANCDKVCDDCRYCRTLAQTHIRKRPLILPDLTLPGQ